jgi:hypothetical protein
VADVPLLGGETFYTRAGDAFAYACALAGIVVMVAARRRARTRAAGAPPAAAGPDEREARPGRTLGT